MTTVHDPIFDVPSRPMYAWGSSPFHMRGVVYRDAIPLFDRLLGPQGLTTAEVLRRNGDALLEAFYRQRFSATEWYDIYPSIHLAPLVAKAYGATLDQHMRTAALVHADWARQGFTSVILKLVSNEAVATWLPRISGWYHDFGRVETRVVGARHVRGTRSGLPVFAVQGWSVLGMHFTEHVLAHAGAKAPRVRALEAEPDGTHEGCPLYRVTFDVEWAE
jgi:hypothetical protein